jgi:hypothetical protein
MQPWDERPLTHRTETPATKVSHYPSRRRTKD